MEQTTIQQLNAAMAEKLQNAGLPFEEVKVFGRMRTNVHVLCIGGDTARKWSTLLRQVFGKTPTCVASSWEAKKNRNTCLKPTMRRGYLIALSDGGAL